MKNKSYSGFSLVEMMIAMLGMAGLSLVIAQYSTQWTGTQNSLNLSAIQNKIISKFQNLISTSQALSMTLKDSSNQTLNQCFLSKTVPSPSGCTGSNINFQLRDESNNIAIPMASGQNVFVDDNGVVCTQSDSTPLCRWHVSAQFTPNCTGGSCAAFPDSLQITISLGLLSYNQSAERMTKSVSAAVAKELFYTHASSVNCAAGEFLAGTFADGSLDCQPLPTPPAVTPTPAPSPTPSPTPNPYAYCCCKQSSGFGWTWFSGSKAFISTTASFTALAPTPYDGAGGFKPDSDCTGGSTGGGVDKWWCTMTTTEDSAQATSQLNGACPGASIMTEPTPGKPPFPKYTCTCPATLAYSCDSSAKTNCNYSSPIKTCYASYKNVNQISDSTGSPCTSGNYAGGPCGNGYVGTWPSVTWYTVPAVYWTCTPQ